MRWRDLLPPDQRLPCVSKPSARGAPARIVSRLFFHMPLSVEGAAGLTQNRDGRAPPPKSDVFTEPVVCVPSCPPHENNR